MHFSTTLLFSLSLALATSVLADLDTESSPLGLRTKPVKTSKRAVSSFLDRRETCRGSCQSCFGASSRECPGSDYWCYDSDEGSAAELCSSGGSTPSTTTTSASAEITNTCYSGASCISCFGAFSRDCPAGSDYDCYDIDEHSQAEGCSAGDGTDSSASASAPSPSASRSADSCRETYGGGNIPCGQGNCYDPTAGETCCGDGGHCKAGTTCVLRGSVYKCAEDGTGSSSPSLTAGSRSSRTASGILNTNTAVGPIGDGSSDPTSSSVPRPSRTTSSRSSTITEPAAAATTSTNSVFGAAPALMGRDTGAVAALAAGLLGLVGVL
ncbi:hypothetical protein EPUS_08621 [Endocarpon pusillum Z07020]|uniref:GPI anchored protein n=1 Tax=Endocarpon pusillum (strain Z07020 / HMAS-L-300199) TaxID=1263415 RepID=U1GDK2_ENDPU|nr:uncharacterized protein EPUS_08621 [Endocarpon pusillum Z07020]ERF75667.1 hypothetical protein EPUS_08621 [Endocarpon pusillum Z07020]